MKITFEMRAEAERRAARVIAEYDVDARWEHVFEGFGNHWRLTREIRILALELETLRQQLCPDLPIAEWADLWEQHALLQDGDSHPS